MGTAPDQKYVKAWRKAGPADFNALKPAGFAIVLCGLLLFLVPGFAVVWAVILAAQIGLSVQRRPAFPCPRCGERYGDTGEFPTFRRPPSCQHCGLPFGAPRDPDGGE